MQQRRENVDYHILRAKIAEEDSDIKVKFGREQVGQGKRVETKLKRHYETGIQSLL